MKWLFASVVTVCVAAVGAFAIYTFGWHNSTSKTSPTGRDVPAASDKLTAQLWAGFLASNGDPGRPGKVLALVYLGSGRWRTDVHPPGSGIKCYILDVNGGSALTPTPADVAEIACSSQSRKS